MLATGEERLVLQSLQREPIIVVSTLVNESHVSIWSLTEGIAWSASGIHEEPCLGLDDPTERMHLPGHSLYQLS